MTSHSYPQRRALVVALCLGLLVLALGAITAAAAGPCTTVCYVDAATGNDANDGDTPATAKKTIQAAIDQVSAGGQVRVLPGSYNETATNRWVLGINGPHQFGLFVEDNTKDGITIMGVTAADVPITDPTLTAADITTNATNNFGYSGIFVEADNVTITGLEIGPNTPGENKNIEIIGENFALTNSFISGDGIDGGSIYFGDWRYDTGTSTSYMTTYTVDNNLFGSGSIITVASGTGVTGPVSGRQITDNDFTNGTGQTWPSISFRGQGGQPWYAFPVGGAVITGNTFNNVSFGAYQWIRATGTYEEPDFDWASYWNDNTYDNATVTYQTSLADPRTFTDGVYPNVRRIGARIQREIDNVAQPGDTVLVNEGTYPESPTLNKSLTLVSDDGRDVTFIELQTGTNYTHSLLITGAEVTVDGFTIVGIDANCPTDLAATNIYLNTQPDNVVIKNNRLQVGLPGGCTTGDDGFGLITEYSGNPDVASLLVENNIFEPLNTAGQRAFYINPSIVDFTFRNNEINGQFNGTAITEAQNNVIEDNTVTGTGASGGLGIWGYLDPGVWGTGTFQRNTITGTANAISIYDAEDVTVTKNILDANGRGVRVLTAAAVLFDQSTIHINRNAITNNTTEGITNFLDQNDYGDIDGMCNWWNAADGPGAVASGSGDMVSADVIYTPWLFSDDLDGPCYVGGNITVAKAITGGGNPSTVFAFDPSWSATNFTLMGGQSETTAPPLQAGSYSVSEVTPLPTGWSLQSATCDNTVTTPVEAVNPAAITVADGDDWVCTFTNLYTPPPANTCAAGTYSSQWTDILGGGMGSPKKHKAQVKLVIPNYLNVTGLYGQMVAKDPGNANYVRFIFPGKNNYVEVNTITSPLEHAYGNFWYGADLTSKLPANQVTGKWFLQKTGKKNHIPRAFVLYPTYNDPLNNYVNVWDTFDAIEGEVYWDTANGWTQQRVINVPIAPPQGETTFNVELALVDNDKDARPVWVTVEAGNVTQTQMPNNPSNGDQLNLMTFTLAGVLAGTDEITITVYSPSMALDGVDGDSAALVGMAANYMCAPIP